MGPKINFMTKKLYTPPAMNIVEIECESMLANSITGSAPDSDDSEFGASAKASRHGEWGNLWQ